MRMMMLIIMMEMISMVMMMMIIMGMMVVAVTLMKPHCPYLQPPLFLSSRNFEYSPPPTERQEKHDEEEGRSHDWGEEELEEAEKEEKSRESGESGESGELGSWEHDLQEQYLR